MTATAIPTGTANWDVPLNAALLDLQGQATSLQGQVTSNGSRLTALEVTPVTKTGAAAGSIVYAAQVTGDTVARYTVGADGKLNWGPGGGAATDTNLYRGAAGSLQTDGSLSLGNGFQVNVGGSGSSASFAALRATGSDVVVSVRLPGNTVSRFALAADGLLQWSNGTAVADVNLNRAGPNQLGVTTADLRIATVGRGLQVAEGSNAKSGTAVLVAGAVTVANTSVTATSRIQLTTQAPGGAVGSPYVSARVAGTSFTITSTSGTDTSTVAYLIIEP